MIKKLEFSGSDRGDRCASGRRCPGWAEHEKAAAAARPDAPLCEACTDRARRDIEAMPALWWELADELVPAQRGMRWRVDSSDDGRVPLALDIEALMRDVVQVLTVWEPPVREAAGLPPERARGVRDSWAVATAARVLAPRVPILASLPPTWGYGHGLDAGPVELDGLDAIEAFRRLRRRIKGVVGSRRLVHMLPGECSRCGAMALRRADGSETVYCGVCDQRWTWDDYRRYVGLILGVLETSPEAADEMRSRARQDRQRRAIARGAARSDAGQAEGR